MTFDADPYRVLGLPRGASTAEVKRAYRILAKQYHPDSAGERALPRFLAIQAAYEALVGPAGRIGGIRATPGGRGASQSRPTGRAAPSGPNGPNGPNRAWEADPARARATRDAYRRKTGPTRGAGPTRGPGPTAGPGARTGPGPTPGAAGAGDASERPRRRGTRKATLGSTSYDDASGPFEATWEGGTWYGASSGTYWTINPKEYADPRKHGPEYLARARRARRSAAAGERLEAPGEDGTGDPTPEPDEPGATADESTSAWPGHARPSTAAGIPRMRVNPHPYDRGAAAPAGDSAPGADSATAGAVVHGAAADRFLLALLGWPPIGVALATLVGEVTGCGRFAAACSAPDAGPFGLAVWLLQLAVLGVLVAVPLAARAAAAGTVGLLAAAIPTAVFLSAIGGSRDPATASALLVGLLGVAWLVGVALHLTGRYEVLGRFRGRVR